MDRAVCIRCGGGLQQWPMGMAVCRKRHSGGQSLLLCTAYEIVRRGPKQEEKKNKNDKEEKVEEEEEGRKEKKYFWRNV